jgi:hypothetical protein
MRVVHDIDRVIRSGLLDGARGGLHLLIHGRFS